MSTIYVTPREGYTIFDPDQQSNLPAGGRLVTASTYWFCRERDGDVTVGQTPVAEASAAPSPSETALPPAPTQSPYSE